MRLFHAELLLNQPTSWSVNVRPSTPGGCLRKAALIWVDPH